MPINKKHARPAPSLDQVLQMGQPHQKSGKRGINKRGPTGIYFALDTINNLDPKVAILVVVGNLVQALAKKSGKH